MNWERYALGLLLCLSGTAVAANPVERGATVHEERGCNACHGQHGVSTAPDQFPHLAGQHASYLEHALQGYRDGTRRNAVMNPVAAALSDDDIRVLAAFYAAQDGLITAPRDRVGPRPGR